MSEGSLEIPLSALTGDESIYTATVRFKDLPVGGYIIWVDRISTFPPDEAAELELMGTRFIFRVSGVPESSLIEIREDETSAALFQVEVGPLIL